MNQVVIGSMRFMLEAAGIGIEGAAGAIKLQGLALAWARVVGAWLDDDEAGLSKTMAALDRELTRGERAAAGVDRLNDMATPFVAFARATMEAGRRIRERGRSDCAPQAATDAGPAKPTTGARLEREAAGGAADALFSRGAEASICQVFANCFPRVKEALADDLKLTDSFELFAPHGGRKMAGTARFSEA